MKAAKVYLGDGVYAECKNGFHITVTAENGLIALETVHLEPEVFAKLVAYAREVWPPDGALGREIERRSKG